MDCIFKGGCDAVCGRTHWMPAALAVSFPCVRRVCVLLTCCTWKQSQRKHLTTWNVWDMSKVRHWKRATTTSPSKKIVSLPFQFCRALFEEDVTHRGIDERAPPVGAEAPRTWFHLHHGWPIYRFPNYREESWTRAMSSQKWIASITDEIKKKKKVLNTDLLIIH